MGEWIWLLEPLVDSILFVIGEKKRARKQSTSSYSQEETTSHEKNQNSSLNPLFSVAGYQSPEDGDADLMLGNYLETSLAFPCNMSSVTEQQPQKSTSLEDIAFSMTGDMKEESCSYVRVDGAKTTPSFQVRTHPTYVDIIFIFQDES